MALRIPPRTTPWTLPLPLAVMHICGLESSLKRHEVGDAIMDAIVAGELTVFAVPQPDLQLWLQNPKIDWDSGQISVDPPHIPATLRTFHRPFVDVAKVIALFSDETSKIPEIAGTRKTGPQPVKRQAVKERMLAALRNGRDLQEEKQESLTAEFGDGATRSTCVQALKDALSELDRE